MINSISDVKTILDEHNAWRSHCLNLVASENVASETMRSMLTCDFGHRYGTYYDDPAQRNYLGCRYISEMEVKTLALAERLFNAPIADLRPLGGEMAGKAVIAGLTSYGDTVFETADPFGAHKLAKRVSFANLWTDSIKVEPLPFIPSGRTVDLEKLEKRLSETQGKLVILGHSHMTAAEPVAEVRALVDQVGGYLAFDASHVMGLIACGVYPNPLDEGAHVVMGSTHKTMPGPQGGIIVLRDSELWHDRIRPALYPTLVTNHHMNRIPAFAVLFLELLEFGPAYGRQIIQNSKALGAALLDIGIQVLYADEGISETHTVLVDVAEYGDGAEIAKRLEASNIITNGVKIPRDLHKDTTSGLRVGTSELARVGMREQEMKSVAAFFKRVIVDKDDPQAVAKDVGEFVEGFQNIAFSFESDTTPFTLPAA
jgi:glycine hydroxymethyltransferase